MTKTIDFNLVYSGTPQYSKMVPLDETKLELVATEPDRNSPIKTAEYTMTGGVRELPASVVITTHVRAPRAAVPNGSFHFNVEVKTHMYEYDDVEDVYTDLGPATFSVQGTLPGNTIAVDEPTLDAILAAVWLLIGTSSASPNFVPELDRMSKLAYRIPAIVG